MQNLGFAKISSVLLVIVLASVGSYYLIPRLSLLTDAKTATEVPQSPPTEGLVAYWNFDDGSGTAAADQSGHGNVATLNNGPTWTSGKIGRAVHTDGMDDLIRINPASFNFNGGTTVAMWVKQEPSGGDNSQSTLLVAMDVDGGRKFAVLLDRGNKRFCIQTPKNDSCTDANSYDAVGNWFHFALVKSAKQTKIFVNGSPIDRHLDTEPVTGSDIGIGRYTAIESRGCNCSFDEFKVYNRALSAREILALYNDTGTAVTSQSLTSPERPTTQNRTP